MFKWKLSSNVCNFAGIGERGGGGTGGN